MIKVFILSLLISGSVFAQDAEWFESTCASRVGQDNFSSIPVFESAFIPDDRNNSYDCFKLLAYFRQASYFGPAPVGEVGEFFYRNEGREVTCYYEVKKQINNTTPFMIEILNILARDVQKPHYMNEIFKILDSNHETLNEAVALNCGFIGV